MSQNQTQILIDFKNNLVKFLDELIEQFPEETDFIISRIFIKDQVPVMDIMNHFITEIIPLKAKIKGRDDKFFIENNILFSSLDKTKVNHLKKIWRSDRLEKEDKEVIWKWIDALVYFVEKYQKTLLPN